MQCTPFVRCLELVVCVAQVAYCAIFTVESEGRVRKANGCLSSEVKAKWTLLGSVRVEKGPKSRVKWGR